MQALDPDTLHRLEAIAQDARTRAYAPYSRFHVGAALLVADGTVFAGANIENASYSMTICAERVAVAQAVSQGHRELRALVLAGDAATLSPCGACRQVLAEFGDDELIIAFPHEGELTTMRLGELLPIGFHGATLDAEHASAWPA
jgi:cytidine deaminase